MRSTLRLANGTLEWLARPGASPDRRRLAGDDEARFRDWAERYRRVLKRLSPKSDLVPHPRRDLPVGTLRNIFRQADWDWR